MALRDHHIVPSYTGPWLQKPLDEWAIVGMNHYHVNGERRLFVAMTKGGRCIVEEGPDDRYLWNRLLEKARTSGVALPRGGEQG